LAAPSTFTPDSQIPVATRNLILIACFATLEGMVVKVSH
jgi:hypothetical protein